MKAPALWVRALCARVVAGGVRGWCCVVQRLPVGAAKFRQSELRARAFAVIAADRQARLGIGGVA